MTTLSRYALITLLAAVCLVRQAQALPLTLALVRAEQPTQSVQSVQKGTVAPYSHYGGPVTTWASGMTIDGAQSIDAYNPQGQVTSRRAEVTLDLAEGEHVINPGGQKFRIAGGKVESLSPDLTVQGDRLSLKLYPVTLLAVKPGGGSVSLPLRVAWRNTELWRTPPGTTIQPLVLYLPGTEAGGYSTNVSSGLCQVSAAGVRVLKSDGSPAGEDVTTEGFTLRVPTWQLISKVCMGEGLAGSWFFGFSLREEATQTEANSLRLGSWSGSAQVSSNASIPYSNAGWTVATDINGWGFGLDETRNYPVQVLLVNRPLYHQPDGKEKEYAVQIGLGANLDAPGGDVPVHWRWAARKGIEPPAAARLVAFLQQAPARVGDPRSWQPLQIELTDNQGILHLPATLQPGRAWLRIGVSTAAAPLPTERLLMEVPLSIRSKPPMTTGNSPRITLRTVRIGTPGKTSRVPPVTRQGVMMAPQSVSALDVNADGQIAVGTMAFKHDKNFWLLAEDGAVQWGRYSGAWAPMQVAALDAGKYCAVGHAYTPYGPDNGALVSSFTDAAKPVKEGIDTFWDLGWMRYGAGDWRTGWPVSFLGDSIARADTALISIHTSNGSSKVQADGSGEGFPLNYQRPLRMAVSGDGHVLACGYLIPDFSSLTEKQTKDMPGFPGLLSVLNTAASTGLWGCAPMQGAPAVPRPPEPSDEFPELKKIWQKPFPMTPNAFAPFRVAMSVGINSDGARVAAAEYGGWMRIRGADSWIGNPYCPRQRGWLRVFGLNGEELARTQFTREGLFELRMSPDGKTVWCLPMSWFARGIASNPWLPCDPQANTVLVYDVARQAFTAQWQFPDALSDLAVTPDGGRLLASCWDGNGYLLDTAGKVLKTIALESPAVLRWHPQGRWVLAGTQNGKVACLAPDGTQRWKLSLPVTEIPPWNTPLKPVYEGVPVYQIGGGGSPGGEHSYLGSQYLIKTDQGGILVDTGGTSALPASWAAIRAAGMDPKDVRYVLVSHHHGDHACSSYLWRALGTAKVVATEQSAFAMTWLTPIWNCDYGMWPPLTIDKTVPITRPGDVTEFTLCGIRITAILVPGHANDSAVYAMDLNGKRVIFSGDSFLWDAYRHCWGDVAQTRLSLGILKEKVLPLNAQYHFMGHQQTDKAMEQLNQVVAATEESLKKAETPAP